VHSNGFSLVRKVIEKANVSLNEKAPWSDKSFGEVRGWLSLTAGIKQFGVAYFPVLSAWMALSKCCSREIACVPNCFSNFQSRLFGMNTLSCRPSLLPPSFT
jgi:hypothetical protein